MTLLPHQRWCDCSCSKPPSLEAKVVYASEACVWALETQGPCGPWAGPTNRSPPSLSPWKTQCAPSIQSWLNAHPVNDKAPTQCGNRVVLALGPRLGQCGSVPGCIICVVQSHAVAIMGQFQPPMMDLLEVKAIAAPEVKFLDRCRSPSGEGVLQVQVRRSRMRAWGSKMIRHRRSPKL